LRGAAGDHSGRKETGARKRRSHAGVLIAGEATKGVAGSRRGVDHARTRKRPALGIFARSRICDQRILDLRTIGAW